MKEYKLVMLNAGLKFSREKDLAAAEESLNSFVAQGWELQQIISPSDLGGAMVAVLWREK